MQGFAIILQMANAIMAAFGIGDLLKGYIGAILFLSVLAYGWNKLSHA